MQMLNLRLKLAANAILSVYELSLVSDITFAKSSIKNVQTYLFNEAITHQLYVIALLDLGSSLRELRQQVSTSCGQSALVFRFVEQIHGGAPPRLQRAVIGTSFPRKSLGSNESG